MLRVSSILGNSQRLDGGAMFGNAPRALWQRWTPPDAENRIELACRALLARGVDGKTVLFETGIGAFFEPRLRERYGVFESEHVLLESLRALGIGRIVLQQVPILFEGGAAAGGRDDDRVVPGLRKCVDIPAGQDACLLHHASVNMERAATLLLDRDVDGGTVSGHDASRCPVGVGKHGPHDAAVEELRSARLVVDRVGRLAFIPGDDRAA